MKQKSLFIVSLDFELFWGVRDKRTIKDYGENIRGVRKVIPSLLQLFDQYKINATFAAVGFLFARKKQELVEYIPSVLPHYTQKKYSPYENNYLNTVGNSEEDDIYHYAESLIRMIQQFPNQEIASHTFSHFYCLENASLASFEADLIAAKSITSQYRIDLKTIVFPRNQYTEDHIGICKKLGFIAYRGNEQSAVYQPRKNEEQSRLIRGLRLGDSYVNLTGHHTFSINKEEDIINIPASRFLRPYSPKLKMLDNLRLKRIRKSMTYAAKHNQAFHLWWHPHNFGINLRENLTFLEEILKHYQRLQHEFGMQSKNMKTIAEEILKLHAV
jgi:peptidoglycan/xylan/chitin deacetylase (PgdA/CDA1 family)